MLEESPKENKLEIAIQRYLELNNQRREALKSVNDFEAEMANLVKENGITLDMVKNAMNQANKGYQWYPFFKGGKQQWII